ncbi:hypothetical protein COCOBI_19-1160 [Coccomyxa sp. Obi]|nr:hypothetical protein COCOBI_19-1160 [Coccomyxa sp. Obi]
MFRNVAKTGARSKSDMWCKFFTEHYPELLDKTITQKAPMCSKQARDQIAAAAVALSTNNSSSPQSNMENQPPNSQTETGSTRTPGATPALRMATLGGINGISDD